MAEVDWTSLTNEEVIASVKAAPRVFGPWEEWDKIQIADGRLRGVLRA